MKSSRIAMAHRPTLGRLKKELLKAQLCLRALAQADKLTIWLAEALRRLIDALIRCVLRTKPGLIAALVSTAPLITASPATADPYVERTGTANPFDGLGVFLDSAPALADVDGDGDLDAVTGSNSGALAYFENTGTPLAPAYTQRTGPANPFDGLLASTGFSTPVLGDLDDDSDLDLVVGAYYLGISYFENTGSANAPAYTQRTGPANPFDGLGVGYLTAPALGDLDGDGDPDMVVGESYGRLRYFENTGSASNPAYTQRIGPANPFDGFDEDWRSKPALGDLDGDGDLDAVVGESGGSLAYFENTGSASTPAYTRRTGSANPFDGLGMFPDSAPALGDLDGDSDLDAVVGDSGGDLHYFEDAASRFQNWQAAHFDLPAEAADAQPQADPDGDGPNLIDYALKLNPKLHDMIGVFENAIVSDGVSLWLEVRDDDPTLLIRLEVVDELADFGHGTLINAAVTDPHPADGFRTLTFTIPFGDKNREYTRMQFELTP